jgi:hypothetical protein
MRMGGGEHTCHSMSGGEEVVRQVERKVEMELVRKLAARTTDL